MKIYKDHGREVLCPEDLVQPIEEPVALTQGRESLEPIGWEGLDVMTKRQILVPAEKELGPPRQLPFNLMTEIYQLSLTRNVGRRVTLRADDIK
jgi:hypothetical protein